MGSAQGPWLAAPCWVRQQATAAAHVDSVLIRDGASGSICQFSRRCGARRISESVTIVHGVGVGTLSWVPASARSRKLEGFFHPEPRPIPHHDTASLAAGFNATRI